MYLWIAKIRNKITKEPIIRFYEPIYKKPPEDPTKWTLSDFNAARWTNYIFHEDRIHTNGRIGSGGFSKKNVKRAARSTTKAYNLLYVQTKIPFPG